ncbi:hypothetical protein AX16_001008 [Volvariella volvacea WC 439]|nr:hypothetical protein AX16_001008 [Volvariella volvacea WC 439]
MQTLVIVYVHGFKGNEESFYQFPAQLERDLRRAIPRISVISKIFPEYETRGDIQFAVQQFTNWLNALALEIEDGSEGGAGSVGIVLCGHSMGGLLIAEALFRKTTPLWPQVIACIGYDSPFLGLHPQGIQRSMRQVIDQGRTVGSMLLAGVSAVRAKAAAASATDTQQSFNGWSRWVKPTAYALGAVAMAGIAGGAYWQRDNVASGFSSVVDHMIFTAPLWDDQHQQSRLMNLVEMDEESHIVFCVFYAYLPSSTPGTFIKLPDAINPAYRHFCMARNNKPVNETEAHMSMFQESTNDGYHQLSVDTIKVIQRALHRFQAY